MGPGILVSILVLLDQPLRHGNGNRNGNCNGFQSLFYWISLCDHPGNTKTKTEKLFQSLFYWISLCDTQCGSPRRKAKGFQSLFYWISLCDLHTCISDVIDIEVSILVLLDQPLRLLMDSFDLPSLQGFQSLFYWISLCDYGPYYYEFFWDSGFNPCFIGLASATS